MPTPQILLQPRIGKPDVRVPRTRMTKGHEIKGVCYCNWWELLSHVSFTAITNLRPQPQTADAEPEAESPNPHHCTLTPGCLICPKPKSNLSSLYRGSVIGTVLETIESRQNHIKAPCNSQPPPPPQTERQSNSDGSNHAVADLPGCLETFAMKP